MKTRFEQQLARTLMLALAIGLCIAPIASAKPVGLVAETSADFAVPVLAPDIPQDIPFLQDIVAVTAGVYNTCALTSGGGVKCWGQAPLGDGTTRSRSTPIDVNGLSSGIIEVAASMSHTCALTSGGGVKCWGANYANQLGDGTSTDRLSPVDVVGLGSDVAAVAVGDAHTCVVSNTGGVKCWGDNTFGQLGNGTTANSATPVDVIGLSSGVAAVAAGPTHTCALTNVGGVKCWGRNIVGQLGDGTKTDQNQPVDVVGLSSGVTAVATGKGHFTCAVISGGGVKCWGSASANGKPYNSATPVTVLGISDAKSVIAGGGHVCALTEASAVKCWGGNTTGQLGDGTTTDRLTPVAVIGLPSGNTALAAGGSHTCAVTGSGGVKCWGGDGSGQLGIGFVLQHTIPMDVLGLSNHVAVLGVGTMHTCVVTDDGGVRCWGLNFAGQIGDGTTTNRSTPVAVVGLGSGISALAAGYAHTCALTNLGGVKCWGWNDFCQLGDGTTTNSSTPVDVVGLGSGVTALAAGDGHTCAITSGGGVKCWGWNHAGQLGDGTNVNSSTPVDVIGLGSGVMALAGGAYHTCAITNAGGVKCWGSLLGDGTTNSSSTPVDVVGLGDGATALTAGYQHTCAVTNAGGVKCWGWNLRFPRFPDDPEFGVVLTPTDVAGLTSGVAKVTAGMAHICALTSVGGVKCWGDNFSGQLGDGTTTNHYTPTDVVGLESGVTAVAGGTAEGDHTCALAGNGRLKCWGRDDSGQLGLGPDTLQLTPVDVLASLESKVAVNYMSGKPGSFLTLTGYHFPASSSLTITVNGAALATTAMTTEYGGFIVFLDTTGADAGFYVVSANAGGATATTSFVLDPGAPLQVQEGGGITLSVPGGIAASYTSLYMPMMLH